jgi:anti-sigma factor RsiW
MTPETARMLLHAHIDGEIDATSTLELTSEIEASPALRQEMERLSALHHVIKTRATRFNAPSRLSKSLHTTLSRSQADSMRLGVPSWWRTLAIGSSAAAAALLLWALGASLVDREPRRAVVEEVVNAHIRSLMADHLTDLASAERHSVKPWLSNRLDFAAPVNEFTSEGFVLVGGRLDYIAGKPAAAIVYQYRQHIINLFVWVAPVSTNSSIRLSTHRGYNSANFESAGMSYWAVSDLNQDDLGRFAKLLQKQSAIK